MVRDILMRLYRRLLADEEGAAGVSGFLSWRGETHALITVGMPLGFLITMFNAWPLGLLILGWLLRGGESEAPLRLPYAKQLLKETGYAISGMMIGSVIAVVAKSLLGMSTGLTFLIIS